MSESPTKQEHELLEIGWGVMLWQKLGSSLRVVMVGSPNVIGHVVLLAECVRVDSVSETMVTSLLGTGNVVVFCGYWCPAQNAQ